MDKFRRAISHTVLSTQVQPDHSSYALSRIFPGSIYVFYTLSRIFTGSIYSTHCQEFHWKYLCILHTLKKFPWKYLFYTLSRIFMEVSILPTVKNFPGSIYTHCKEFPLLVVYGVCRRRRRCKGC